MYSVPTFCINATPISVCFYPCIPICPTIIHLSVLHSVYSYTHPKISTNHASVRRCSCKQILLTICLTVMIQAQLLPLLFLSLFSLFHPLTCWGSIPANPVGFCSSYVLWPAPLRGLWPLLLGDRGSVTKRRLRRCCWPEEAVMPGCHPIRAVCVGQSHSQQFRNNSNNNTQQNELFRHVSLPLLEC